MIKTCPTPEVYRRILTGQTGAEQLTSLTHHLGECSQCSDTVQMLLNSDTLAIQLTATKQNDSLTEIPGELLNRLMGLSVPPKTVIDETIGHPEFRDPLAGVTGMLEPAQSPGELGRLGNYIVRDVLGQGGMGIVFRAYDPRLDREVALKVIRPTTDENPTIRKRFLSEARSAARIKSDHIVTIYDIGESNGTAYVAMEYLRGTSLGAALTQKRKFTIEQIQKIGREIAQGLSAAHDQGLIHRDIKPDNIWLEETTERVKLLDFGLARPINKDIHLTNDGIIVGTPAYMAPEQARGHAVDSRSDLFSLGVVLYVLITGRRPFTGENTIAILSSLALDNPPSPEKINPKCPPELANLVIKLLEKEPANRPLSANAALAALSPTQNTVEPMRPKVRPTTHRRKTPIFVWVLLGLLMLGGVMASAYKFVLATKDGTLIVEVDEDADVRFKKGKLEIYDDKGQLKYTLEPAVKSKTVTPGKYVVKVIGADGLKLETDTFVMERKGKAFVKVKAEDLPSTNETIPPATGGSVLVISSTSKMEAPNPGIDPKKPWTVEGYFTPLNAACLTVSHQRDFIRINGVFALLYKDGIYQFYAHHQHVAGSAMKVGQRVHIAGVRTETEIMIFIDGKLAGRTEHSILTAIDNGLKNPLIFGIEKSEAEFAVEGFRLSRGNRYLKDFTVPAGLDSDKDALALYHCDEGTGDKLADSSEHARHGKIAGVKWIKAIASDEAIEPQTEPVVQPEEGKYYRIRNIKTRMVLAVDGTMDGDRIVQLTPGPKNRQFWKFVKIGDYYNIINRQSGKALNVVSGSKDEGAELVQWDIEDNTSENQQWSLVRKGQHFVLQARHSGLVIDAFDGSTTRREGMIQWPYQESRNQIFELIPAKN